MRASQKGDGIYKSAKEVEKTFTVNKVQLYASADSKFVEKGKALPALSISYSGFVNGENASVIDQKPKVSVKIKNTSTLGSFPITVESGKDNNYTIVPRNGTLTVVVAGSSGSSSGLVTTGAGTLTLSGSGTTGDLISLTGAIVSPGNSGLGLQPIALTQAGVPPVLLTPGMIAGIEARPSGITILGDYNVREVSETAVYLEGDVLIKSTISVSINCRISVRGDLKIESAGVISFGPDTILEATGGIYLDTFQTINPPTAVTVYPNNLSGGSLTIGNYNSTSINTNSNSGSVVLLASTHSSPPVTINPYVIPGPFQTQTTVPTASSTGSSSFTSVTVTP